MVAMRAPAAVAASRAWVWLIEYVVVAKTTEASRIARATSSGGSSPFRLRVGYSSRRTAGDRDSAAATSTSATARSLSLQSTSTLSRAPTPRQSAAASAAA